MPFKRDNVLVWASDLEEETLQQAAKASRLPFLAGHLALMPDAHIGKGATIGSVIPTKGAIIPAAVGVDIGCGMIASRTSLTVSQLPDNLDKLMPLIEERIPAGVGKGHSGRSHLSLDPYLGPLLTTNTSGTSLTREQRQTASSQFGTLGSGNHFVEVCLDEEDNVWIVLHSGSRGIGNQLATWHINEAKGAMKKLFIKLEDPDLAYFVEKTPEFQSYIADLIWAQDYAMGNREAMMNQALISLMETVNFRGKPELERINCHHNYTAQENHNGQNMWITRKGAIRARIGDLGIIPGSMGTNTYIVEGLGNPSSYNSCSHGAGRRMSRSAAKRDLDLDVFKKQMDGKAWNSDRATSLLDEAPNSYKDVKQVMEDQKDLVKIVHTLSQIFNYKG